MYIKESKKTAGLSNSDEMIIKPVYDPETGERNFLVMCGNRVIITKTFKIGNLEFMAED